MTIPATTGQIWPHGGSSDPAALMTGIQVFSARNDLPALRLAALQTFLGLGGTSSSTPDDAEAILASQVFGA